MEKNRAALLSTKNPLNVQDAPVLFGKYNAEIQKKIKAKAFTAEAGAVSTNAIKTVSMLPVTS